MFEVKCIEWRSTIKILLITGVFVFFISIILGVPIKHVVLFYIFLLLLSIIFILLYIRYYRSKGLSITLTSMLNFVICKTDAPIDLIEDKIQKFLQKKQMDYKKKVKKYLNYKFTTYISPNVYISVSENIKNKKIGIKIWCKSKRDIKTLKHLITEI